MKGQEIIRNQEFGGGLLKKKVLIQHVNRIDIRR